MQTAVVHEMKQVHTNSRSGDALARAKDVRRSRFRRLGVVTVVLSLMAGIGMVLAESASAYGVCGPSQHLTNSRGYMAYGACAYVGDIGESGDQGHGDGVIYNGFPTAQWVQYQLYTVINGIPYWDTVRAAKIYAHEQHWSVPSASDFCAYASPYNWVSSGFRVNIPGIGWGPLATSPRVACGGG